MVSFFSNEHLSYTGIKNIIINLSPSISIHKWLNFKRPFLAHFITTIYKQRFPNISADVEMADVATPLTFERYTGNWKGSIIGWDLTTETAFKPIPKMLPGLQNFWMAGQWVEVGGGIPMVALSGRNVIQLIARADKKPFKTGRCS